MVSVGIEGGLWRVWAKRAVAIGVCLAALVACGDDGGGSGTGCPADQALIEADLFDINDDGVVDDADQVDLDHDGEPDDYDGDGAADNRFYFNDASKWLPDADSFDDYEAPGMDIPRGVTNVPGECPADGIATGPLDLSGMDGRPTFDSWRPSHCCLR